MSQNSTLAAIVSRTLNKNHSFLSTSTFSPENEKLHPEYFVAKPGNSGISDFSSPVFTTSESSTELAGDNDHFCKRILYIEIGDSRVRIWDLLLLFPVFLFLLGLLFKLNNARITLRAVHSPIYATFYALIWLNALVALVRCIVSMTVNAATTSGDEANILLYIIVRFFLLATEMSVVTFAVFFGHLDNRTSIRRVLAATAFVAFPYAVVQGSLELIYPDTDFYVESKDYKLFGHGGSIFLLASSVIFSFVYCFILLLKLDCLRKRFLFLLWMPTKKSFYMYLSFLALLNIIQSIGSGLYDANYEIGLCIVDVTSWTYFSLLTPLIYFIFVYNFFRVKHQNQMENIIFSYKSEDDDTTSLPPNIGEYLHSAAAAFQTGPLAYNSLTEEDSSIVGVAPPVNPLYSASLQSPDSITGCSINSCESITIAAYDASQTR